MMEEDMIISSNDVIPFFWEGRDCDPKLTERVVHDDQRSMVILLTKQEKTYKKDGIQEESSVTRNL